MVVVKPRVVILLAFSFVAGCGKTSKTTSPVSEDGGARSADGGAPDLPPAGDPGSGAGGTPSASSGGLSEGGTLSTSSGGLSQGGSPSEGGALSTSSGGLSQGGAPPDSTLEPIRVIRGNPQQTVWGDLTIRGVALGEYEGKVVTVRLGMPDRPPERLGSGQARIEQGAFELSFPQVWEDSLYKLKLVYVDLDGDGACDLANDKLFADSRAVMSAELIVRGSGSHEVHDFFLSQQAEYCASFNSAWPGQ